MNNGEVRIAVTAPAREGLANAEVLDHMARILGTTRQQLQLSRGWSHKSKFLLVSNMTAVDVFKKLRGSVETDLLPLSAGGPTSAGVAAEAPPGQDDVGPAATAGHIYALSLLSAPLLPPPPTPLLQATPLLLRGSSGKRERPTRRLPRRRASSSKRSALDETAGRARLVSGGSEI